MLTPMLLDILSGRHCCRCNHIQPEGGVLPLDGFSISGTIVWETWLHRHFWNEVALGNLRLNFRKLLARGVMH